MNNFIPVYCPKGNSNSLYKYDKDTISDWCKKFAPVFHSKMPTLMPTINFNSDERHTDETVAKILGTL